MTLQVVVVDRGTANLGRWGRLELSGASTATLRLTQCEDLKFEGEAAETLTSDDILLNEESGRLICLPQVATVIVRFDLESGTRRTPDLTVDRNPDFGLRASGVKAVDGVGVVYRAEKDLILFNEQTEVVWRVTEDFAEWAIEEASETSVSLVSTKWPPRGERQTRSMATGQLV